MKKGSKLHRVWKKIKTGQCFQKTYWCAHMHKICRNFHRHELKARIILKFCASFSMWSFFYSNSCGCDVSFQWEYALSRETKNLDCRVIVDTLVILDHSQWHSIHPPSWVIWVAITARLSLPYTVNTMPACCTKGLEETAWNSLIIVGWEGLLWTR